MAFVTPADVTSLTKPTEGKQSAISRGSCVECRIVMCVYVVSRFDVPDRFFVSFVCEYVWHRFPAIYHQRLPNKENYLRGRQRHARSSGYQCGLLNVGRGHVPKNQVHIQRGCAASSSHSNFVSIVRPSYPCDSHMLIGVHRVAASCSVWEISRWPVSA